MKSSIGQTFSPVFVCNMHMNEKVNRTQSHVWLYFDPYWCLHMPTLISQICTVRIKKLLLFQNIQKLWSYISVTFSQQPCDISVNCWDTVSASHITVLSSFRASNEFPNVKAKMLNEFCHHLLTLMSDMNYFIVLFLELYNPDPHGLYSSLNFLN